MKKLIFILTSMFLFSNYLVSMEAPSKTELKDLPVELREIILKFSPEFEGSLEEVAASIASLARTNKELRDLVHNNFEHIYEALEKRFANKRQVDIFDSLAYRFDPEVIINFLKHSAKIQDMQEHFEDMISQDKPNIASAILSVKGGQISKNAKVKQFNRLFKDYADNPVKRYLVEHAGWTEDQVEKKTKSLITPRGYGEVISLLPFKSREGDKEAQRKLKGYKHLLKQLGKNLTFEETMS